MVAHGAEQAAARHEDYMKKEVASLGERIRRVEDRLAQTLADIDRLEARISNIYEG